MITQTIGFVLVFEPLKNSAIANADCTIIFSLKHLSDCICAKETTCDFIEVDKNWIFCPVT